MKFLFAILLTVVSISAKCGKEELVFPIDKETGLLKYSDVVNVEGMSQSDIYSKMKLWIAENYASTRAVVKLDDAQNATVVMKVVFPVSASLMGAKMEVGDVHYTLTVECKDGRYRMLITNMYHENNQPGQGNGGAVENEKPACGTAIMMKSVWNKIREQANAHALALQASAKDFMLKKEPAAKKDQW